jgi:hypothetical protein
METSAKMRCPVRKPNENHRPGGALRASIGSKVSYPSVYKVEGRVGSKKNYTLVAHEGARPHIIRPRHKRMLSFKWNKAHPDMVTKHGRYAGHVLLSQVRHPGMKGRDFLTAPLRAIAPLRGYKIRVFSTF